MNYNVSQLIIEYHNDTEYRETIRKLFNMKHIKRDTKEEEIMDEVTADELDYDYETINKTMDELYEKTKDNPLFQTLYDLAAAKMISLDRTIGQSVLFSYNYLYLFHACLCVFIMCPNEFTEQCEYYRELKTKLETR